VDHAHPAGWRLEIMRDLASHHPRIGDNHRRAAGAELREPLETARERVLDVARALLGPSV